MDANSVLSRARHPGGSRAVLGKYLASLIYGLPPWDPQATLLIAVLMVAAALVASWLPARRAAALPLFNALRAD